MTILIALAMFPAIASAGVGPITVPTFPTTVTVGQNGTASITIARFNTAPNVADVNRVCNSVDAAPCTGGILLIPTCSLISGGACLPAGADPGVFTPQATGTGTGGVCTGVVFSIAVLPDAFGTWRFTPQAGAHVDLATNAQSCEIGFQFYVEKSPVDQDPGGAPGNQTGQDTRHVQCILPCSPASLSNNAQGTSNGTTVQRAQPSITTLASPNIIKGDQLTDQATISTLVAPVAGSTVSFRLYAPGDTACTTSIFTSTQVVTIAGTTATATSAPFTPTAVGTYRWIATFNGDVNNLPIAGACGEATETRTVSLGTPAIVTDASADVVLGGQLTDTAIVNGRVNAVAGGTIDFRLYGPNNTGCTGAPVFTSLNVPYPVLGGSVTSAAFTPTQAGTYRWIATYSGDANNAGIAGTCNDATENADVTSPPGTPPAAPPPPPPPAAAPPCTPPPGPAPSGGKLCSTTTPPPDCTTPPGPAPSGGELCPRGTARISGKTGCQGSPFRVTVTGRQVERVIFTLDGKVVQTLTRANRGSLYVLNVNPRKARTGIHRIRARVVFKKSSGTPSRTLRVTFSRCARTAASPSFTG